MCGRCLDDPSRAAYTSAMQFEWDPHKAGVAPLRMKQEDMKRTPKNRDRDTLRKEYTLDYAKSQPNRFAAKLKDTTAVVLQPDVAEVFQSAEAVNELLRSAIVTTGAGGPKRRPAAGRSGGRVKRPAA
jgi:hypothetical protein